MQEYDPPDGDIQSRRNWPSGRDTAKSSATRAASRWWPPDPPVWWDNIEPLGSKEDKPTQRHRGCPIRSAHIYSALHTVRIYGNLVVHVSESGSTTSKNALVKAMDIQVALAVPLRVAEWYFEYY